MLKEKTKLQIAREQKGLSVMDMTEKTDLPRVSYYRYEKDQRIPDVRTAIRIANSLETTVETLWGSKAPPRDPLPES